jgi:predicted Zn-dependent protease
MRAVFRKHNYCLILIVALFFSFNSGGFKAFALSIEEERKMGEQFVMQISQAFRLVEDDFANSYLNDLGQYLLRSLEVKPFPFHFYIIQNGDLNAFAGPGGHIFFFTGLIELMEEVDELAGVLSHEIAHVSARHLAERMEQSTKIQLATLAGILLGALVGGDASGAIMSGSIAAGMQKQLAYSRDNERQADQLGFKYMAEAGFDPSGMIETLKKIQKGQMLATNEIPTYLLTHPGGSERMANYETMIFGDKPLIQEKGGTTKYRQFFPIFKTILRAKYMEPKEAERIFKRELGNDPDAVWAHFGLGIVLREMREYQKALDHFHKALRGQPRSVLIMRDMAEAYRLMGREEEAITLLSEALKIQPRDRSSLYLMALAYQNMEEYSEAIPIFEKLASMKPVKNDVFYNLGVSYGRLGRLAPAHYYFGIYFKNIRKIGKALYHFEKAEDLSKNNPALQRRIKKAKEGLT